MSHWLILPVLLPLLCGALLITWYQASMNVQRLLSILSCLGLTLLGIYAVAQSGQGGYTLYYLGNWEAPYGITLVLDRLSALMLLVTAGLSLCCVLYACRTADRRGAHFHPLFQFQLAGINGAFLTGDMFNLFVFFEILLIASYALLLHGGGRARSRAGLHYVIINLVGSALFILAVGTLYGLTGTLNMADMARIIAESPEEKQPLITSAGLLLLVVFGIKAAVLPLLFWLPRAYSAATAPVAALFAIMTKVGIYAIIRVFLLVFGAGDDPIFPWVWVWLWPLALVTLVLGGIGVLGSASLRTMTAYLVIISVGVLLAAITLPGEETLAATLFYLIHSTILAAVFFLIADLVGRQREEGYDRFYITSPVGYRWLLGGLFFIAAIGMVGLPPFSGFISKAWLLQSAAGAPGGVLLWGGMIGASFLVLMAVSRAGSGWFWKPEPIAAPLWPLDKVCFSIVAVMLALSLSLAIWANPVMGYLLDAAAQLRDPNGYIEAVLGGLSAGGVL
ncbi:monovalent cation/H+ antiporter subunit D [Marinimicrobium alkaliphilum]|uniref:monovalent cation/H+ antiporter subunit D n=1 Tax=Marinimicrobium alkaliphilum TaxID=2202654 RepID=UPI000DBA0817|nr:monovalent cation/H+ antiporter subunit D [Marinimicrobium alkaliphilum]